MDISHLLYKVDNLKESVQKFRDMGFQVEYGREKEPYNALIYFPDHSYIELIENMHITSFIKMLLKLFRMKEYLETSLEQEKVSEGFFRLAFHMEEDEKGLLKRRYKEILECDTFLTPVSRKDIHGNTIKCKCLLPSNANYPFFNTALRGGDVWNIEHPNKINGIKKLVYSATKEEIRFFRGLSIDTRIEIVDGSRGISYIEFNHSKSQNSIFRYGFGKWF
ncbi:MAG: VOC family protein [Ruminococcus sp.]|nr:VOC family protein [Ruminococcus sp.]